MNIVFANEDLRDEFNNQDSLVRRYGSGHARVMRQRLDELFNAAVLEDIRAMPHLSIAGSMDGPDLALDLGASFRLIFRPVGDANHGQKDWKKIESILILGLRKHDAEPKP